MAQRARLEDEEVHPLGDARHLAENAVEDQREQLAERQRQQTAAADQERGFPQQHRRDARAADAERPERRDFAEPLVDRHRQQRRHQQEREHHRER